MRSLTLVAGVLTVGSATAQLVAEVTCVELDRGSYYLTRPDAVPNDAPTPLIFALHGTQTRAVDVIDAWRRLDHTLPVTIVAPQSGGIGWCDGDLAHLEDVLSHVRANVPHDPRRVLLTGHSAGGALALHLLYVEGFPATAVAVTANYVPPTVSVSNVRSHRDIPLFYAVGKADPNRFLMRDGLNMLRGQRVSVTVRRPDIGHVFDPNTIAEALLWFQDHCRQVTDSDLNQAADVLTTDDAPGSALAAMERIVGHPLCFDRDHTARAADLAERLRLRGKILLARADSELGQRHVFVADDLLHRIERRYAGSSLAAEARWRRIQLERRPELAWALRLERTNQDMTTVVDAQNWLVSAIGAGL